MKQAWAYRLAVGRYERIRQQRSSKDIAHLGEIHGVIGQKSGPQSGMKGQTQSMGRSLYEFS